MNLLCPAWDAEVDGEGGTLRAVRLAQHAGAQRLAANLYELEPGALVSPLHFHHTNPSLSTCGETLIIEESVNLEGENGDCWDVGDEHEWSQGCG